MPEAVQLPGVDAMSRRFEPLLEQSREREIHVVAAEQDVLADRDALERQVAVPLADRDQAEVGRAAADVADQDEIADLDPPPPAVAERVEPGVERRLRLLEQRDVLEAGSCAPPAGSARAPPRRTTPARSAGRPAAPARERRRRPRPRDRTRPRGASDTRPRRRPARVRDLGRRAPRQIGAVRFAPPCDSHDFADATRRAGFSAPRRRASSPTTKRGVSSQGSARLPAGKSSSPGT